MSELTCACLQKNFIYKETDNIFKKSTLLNIVKLKIISVILSLKKT